MRGACEGNRKRMTAIGGGSCEGRLFSARIYSGKGKKVFLVVVFLRVVVLLFLG